MDINLKVAAPRLFPESRFEMVYFEAIANALDAKATKIDIEIEFENSEFKNFIISDNGIGLNEDQYRRFSELMDAKDNAHKGQGRLVYLIYFKNVEVTSQFIEGNKFKKRYFHFNFDFKKENNSLSLCSEGSLQGTKLSFSGKLKKIAKYDYLRADYIREQVFAEFLPCLFQLKQDNREFQININTKINDEELNSSINMQDIPSFKCVEIDTSELVIDNSSYDLLKEPKTKLYYFLKTHEEEDNVSSLITSFAIDNRAKKVDIVDKPNYIPNLEATFFLVSKHFEGCIDPTRQELTLKPEEFRRVKAIFRRYVKDILEKNFPEYQNIIEDRRRFLIDRFPHLIGYIDSEEIGFKSNRDVIKDAQDKFFKDQREILEKNTLDEHDYEKALELSAKNLAEYILFRQLQIKQLKNIKKEDREKIIHNIISPMGKLYTRDCDSNVNSNIFKNNAWILDDRFMTYIQAASDKTLQDITVEFNKIFKESTSSKDRPDYLMFFSNTLQNESDKVDLVCFEFKRLGVRLEEKTKAVTELTKYIKQLKSVCENIQRVWLYALVDFDSELEESLESQDFKMKFSTQGKIWYRYYENIESELAFLDFDAVVSDADSRNQTFMEILKKGFAYEK